MRLAALGLTMATIAFIAPASAQAAYDLTVSASSTTNVTCSSGVCAATGSGANLSVTDLQTDLAAGNVVLSTGSGGAQTGTITVSAPVSAGATLGGLTFQPAAGIVLDGVSIATGGSQVYGGPVGLNGNVVMTPGASLAAFTGTVDGSYSLTVNGSSQFDGVVGGTTALSGLTVSGPTVLAGNVSTLGAQAFQGAVQLGADVTLQSTANGPVTFGSTLDGQHALDVTTLGQTNFGGAVGGTTALSSLAVSGPAVLAGNVTTAGAQAFQGAVQLGADTTLQAANGPVTFGSTLDGQHALDVTTLGQTNFDGAVGGTTPLSSLLVSGPAVLAGNVTTAAAQDFQGSVQLTGTATLRSEANGAVTFGSTLDGQHPLSVSTQGQTNFGGAVGGTTPLSSLAVSGGGPVALGGDVNTALGQVFAGPVQLGSDVTLHSSGSGAIDLAATVDGTHALTVTTQGQTSFGGAVGGTTGLSSLRVAGPATLGGNVTTGGPEAFQGAVQLAADVTLDSSAKSTIDFASTVNGAHSLTVLTQGVTTFGGAVGGTTPLTNLATVNWAGATLDFGGDVSVTGLADITEPVSLLANDTFTTGAAGSFRFGYPVTGSHLLTAAGSGIIYLAASSGDAYGGTVVDGGTLAFTSGALGSGPVTLNGGTLMWWSQLSPADDVTAHGLTVGSNGGTLDTNSYDVTLAGGISGTGALTTDTGSGTLTLAGTNTSYGGAIDDHSGTLDVIGSISTPITVDSHASLDISGSTSGAIGVGSGGTLDCAGGTIDAAVTNTGGTLSGAPASPTAVTATPGIGSATVSFTPGAANCYPVTYRAAAAPGGATSAASGTAPLTVDGLIVPGPFTFTVTATNPVGSAASAASGSVTPLAAAPSVAITSPGSAATYELGQTVDAAYTCQDGTGGPGISSCAGTVAAGAPIDTATTGSHTFTVTATSTDGQSVTTTVTYDVVQPPFTLRSHRTTARGVILLLRIPCAGTVRVIESVKGARTITRTTSTSAAGTVRVQLPWLRLLTRRLRHPKLRIVRLKIVFSARGGSSETRILVLRRR